MCTMFTNEAHFLIPYSLNEDENAYVNDISAGMENLPMEKAFIG